MKKKIINKKQILINSIMESIAPEIDKIIKEQTEMNNVEDDTVDEAELNEFFGFGSSSIKKPEKTYSFENTDDENVDIMIAWTAYYMDQAGNNVKKGVESILNHSMSFIVKSPMIIVKTILKLMSKGARYSTYGVATIAGIILASISLLVKLTVSGVNGAKDALETLYSNIKKGINAFYEKFKSNTDKMVTDSKDVLTVWFGIVAGALIACANKIEGAVDRFEELFGKIIKDASEKVDAAVLMVKTWLQTKSEVIKKYVSEKYTDIRKTVIAAWNAMDKKVRKAYNTIAEKLEDWISDIKDLLALASEKIEKVAKEVKDFTIDTKDKALIWGIQKGVKGLSDKYSEEQVVALVRKCYNESLIPAKGKYMINEAYFYNAASRQRKLYEYNKRLR